MRKMYKHGAAMNNNNDINTIRECLRQINPSILEYNEWLAVGMACKDAGLPFAEWDAWSAADKRYKPREMQAKWQSFRRGDGVGIGTVVKLCHDQGGEVVATGEWMATRDDEGHELEWDAVIGPREPTRQDLQVVRREWLQDADLPVEPNGNWDGREDLKKYLKTLYSGDERVGYVIDTWESDPDAEGRTKHLPKRGNWDRTAGELLEALARARDLGDVVGDWNEKAGAWIRFNPLDGDGCRDTNVTAYRYALVESDDISIERQYAIYQQIELPIAALVHSGGKSLHAIVRIDAPDFKEYQKRVDFLYEVCKKNGLSIDRQNRNPSRLSRLPGATRNGKRQWLVATNIGQPSWGEWADWIAAVNDDLPEVECAADHIANPPPLADVLIDGVLRKGHKLLLAGPSKAGKSFLLLELAIAIAEGRPWLGWNCAKGRVLYVNLELDRASSYHRLRDLYQAMGLDPRTAADIDVWNLRGKAMSMDHLAPKLIRRALKGNYAAVIIDPIYKVITGDENAADQMAKFCNQFDRVCHELGAAVIYCHHHSKGDQGQKRAHDRASGSGVFARDPDALLDLIELQLDDARQELISNRWECDAMAAEFDRVRPAWRDDCSQDDAIVAKRLAQWAEANGLGDAVRIARPAAIAAAEIASGWRIEGIMREFPTVKPRRCFFRWPLHVADAHGLLDDARAEGELPPKRSAKEAGRDKAQRTIDSTRNAIDACREGENCSVKTLIEYMGLDKTTVYKRLSNAGFAVQQGLVVPDAGE